MKRNKLYAIIYQDVILVIGMTRHETVIQYIKIGLMIVGLVLFIIYLTKI